MYRDAALQRPVGMQKRAIPSLRNTMIHIIAGEGVVTVVVDEKDVAMEEIIAAISSALCDDILYIPAEFWPRHECSINFPIDTRRGYPTVRERNGSSTGSAQETRQSIEFAER